MKQNLIRVLIFIAIALALYYPIALVTVLFTTFIIYALALLFGVYYASAAIVLPFLSLGLGVIIALIITVILSLTVSKKVYLALMQRRERKEHND